MSKVKKLLNFVPIDEMGRPRKDFFRVYNGLQDTLEEHLWKIFAYHSYYPQETNGWLNSLNKHLPKLRRFDIPKEGSNPNVSKEDLYEKLAIEPFQGAEDIEFLSASYAEKGYPVVYLDDASIIRVQNLAKKFVDLIFHKTGVLTVSQKELL